MARNCWIIDNIGIAKKVRHASKSSPLQIKDCGASRECPQCHYLINNKDVTNDWPGLPAGVKFDPSDLELIHHLAAKCGIGNVSQHLFIDEFIPTLDGDQGICYTHPENLPGAMKDGSSIHFFHRTANAYATGQRKRRKIQTQPEKQVRWHKTGKTKAVLENGIQLGCKKIMVLYYSSRKGFKPDKASWVMHQYHLGTDEDEKESEFVVSKIFYQHPKQTEHNWKMSPKTPTLGDCGFQLTGTPIAEQFNQRRVAGWLAGESHYYQAQDVDDASLNDFDDSSLCGEIIKSYVPCFNDPEASHFQSGFNNNVSNPAESNRISSGFADLENLELDTPPEFSLTGLYFGSQDSVFDWLDRM